MDNPSLEQADLVSRMWLDWASKMATVGTSFQPIASPPEAARQLRNNFFQAMSQFFDQFMRSPQMLEWMKQSMDNALACRKQYNDFLTHMRHELQGTASEDIDNVMLAIRHMEDRMLGRMDDLDARLEAMSDRLAAIEGEEAPSSNGSSETRRGLPANSPKERRQRGSHS